MTLNAFIVFLAIASLSACGAARSINATDVQETTGIELCPSGQKNRLGLALYDRGRIWVERDDAGTKVLYDLRCLHAVVYTLGGGLVLGLLVFFLQVGPTAIKFVLGVLAIGYGVNLFFAFAKVPSLLRGTINGS